MLHAPPRFRQWKKNTSLNEFIPEMQKLKTRSSKDKTQACAGDTLGPSFFKVVVVGGGRYWAEKCSKAKLLEHPDNNRQKLKGGRYSTDAVDAVGVKCEAGMKSTVRFVWCGSDGISPHLGNSGRATARLTHKQIVGKSQELTVSSASY